MIKFFRRIRQRLLQKNNYSRYLIYAIGEIILVVIGILIALQLNNWNENRKSKNAEAQSLVELLAEFKKNQIDLMRVHRIKTNAETRVMDYLYFINNENIPDTDKNYVFRNSGANTWNTPYTVLNGLVSSGAINNIKNDSLKYLLTTWNDYVDDYLEQQEFYHMVISQNYFDYLVDKVPGAFRLQDSTYSSWGKDYFESKEEIQRLSMEVIPEIEYQNLLKNLGHRLYIQLYAMQPLIKNSPKIVALLEEEIGRNK